MVEIRRFYEELNKFWTEEIRCVIEALKKGRTDPKDLERWNKFHSCLKQTLESWKVCLSPYYVFYNRSKYRVQSRQSSGGDETLRSNNTSSSTVCLFPFHFVVILIDRAQGADLGVIAFSLSPTIGSLEEALERMSLSASLQYSQLGRSLFQRVYVAFAGNSGLCLWFLQRCAGYGEKVLAWCHNSIASPLGAPSDLRERIMGLLSEASGVSAEHAADAQGLCS